MLFNILSSKNHFNKFILFFGMFYIITFFISLHASNLSDATTLRKKCEESLIVLEVPVKNFGDKADLDAYAEAEKTVKQGKLHFVQSKYPEAIKKYNEYLKMQHNIYKSLSKKYITNTAKLLDEVSEDQVDNIDNQKVAEYIRLANQNLNDAKTSDVKENYKNSISLCRTAKEYSLSTYKVIGKDVPKKYKKDMTDNKGKIYQ